MHNGIIENQGNPKKELISKGLEFYSDTDTEVIVNSVYLALQEKDDLLDAVFKVCEQISGSYALGIMSKIDPDRLIAVEKGVLW